jgi:hypothetical protein
MLVLVERRIDTSATAVGNDATHRGCNTMMSWVGEEMATHSDMRETRNVQPIGRAAIIGELAAVAGMVMLARSTP